jgi:cytochrome c553
MDGAKIYKQQCAVCHGETGKKVPKGGVGVLAGSDATKLAREIRAYRDQDNEVGAYTMHKSSQVMKQATDNLSREQIVALAKYISALK